DARSAYTNASAPPYPAARSMPTPVRCMIRCGSTGRMMPKPVASTSNVMNMNAKAPLPACGKLMNSFPGRALSYTRARARAGRLTSAAGRKTLPQPVRGHAGGDDEECQPGVAGVGKQCIADHEDRGRQEYQRH